MNYEIDLALTAHRIIVIAVLNSRQLQLKNG
jgi:hypothetical protein